MNSPVSLVVSPAFATPQVFSVTGFEALFSLCWNPGLRSLSRSQVVPPGLSTSKSGTAWSSSCHLVPLVLEHPLHPSCLSPPLLPVCMNVSSLTPWLFDFHTAQFYGSSSYFLFLNLLLSFFCLCKEAKYKCKYIFKSKVVN